MNIEKTNARIRQEQQRTAIADELSDRKNDAAALTLKLRHIEKQKADALAQVEFPVAGLGFDEDALFGLHEAYLKLNQPEKAKAALQELIKRMPGTPAAEKAKRLLAQS